MLIRIGASEQLSPCSASYVSSQRGNARICCCRTVLLLQRRAALDRYLLPAGRPAVNPLHAAAAVDRWDRRADGHRTVTQTLLRVLYASSQ